MHIIYIHSHDTGRYIEPYGYGISTPNLMKLAREGTLFRQAYCASPSCSPSRSALLTGMVPHANGMLGLAHRGFRLHDHSRHLSHYLGRHGYETALCGIQHEAAEDRQLDYKHILHDKRAPEQSLAEWDRINARKTAGFIRDYAERAGNRPLFLSFGMVSTHRAFPEPHEVNPDYVGIPYPLYDCPANREDMAAFAASAAVMDECAGAVLTALRETGLDEDALILYTTDHGIAFPLMKCTLYDSGIGVSLIVKLPGNRLAGRASDALVSQLDLFPTLCDAAGIPQPDWLQGASLLPILRGGASGIRNELFAELNFHAAKEPMRCIRSGRYKLIRRYETFGEVLAANIDDGPAKRFMLDAGLLRFPAAGAREKLFDLYLDPVERVDVRHDSQYADIGRDLSGRLDEWMRATDDPLLNGALQAPEGARVNVSASLSPSDRDYES